MTYMPSLRFGTLGHIHMAFGDAWIDPGVRTHRLTLPVQVTGTWLAPDQPTSGFEWTRADAGAILAATAGVLARYTSP